MTMVLKLHHHVVTLDLDGDRLGDIRPLHDARARLDMSRIRLDAEAAGVAVGLAGAHVEFPAVPGATDDLPNLLYSISPGSLDCASPIRGPSHSAAP